MTNYSQNPDNFCYRHPDRQSFVLCQRCGRTICGECQTQAAVGVHCPECVREQRGSMPRVRPQSVTRMRSVVASGAPVATYTLMGLSVLGFLVSLIPGAALGLAYAGPLALIEPWRLVTSLFLHVVSFQGFISLLFNLYSIFFFGRILETQLGRTRFAALFLLSGLGAEVAVSLFVPFTYIYGATPAIFGMFAAFFVIQRHLGQNAVQFLVILGLNVVIAISFGGPWQADIGGIVIGAAAASIMMQTREIRALNRQRIYLIGLAVVLVLIALVRAATF